MDLPTSRPFNSFVTLTNYLMLITILLSGDTFSKVSTMFCKHFKFFYFQAIMGMSVGSQQFYQETVVPNVDKATKEVLETFLLECRLNTPDRSKVR